MNDRLRAIAATFDRRAPTCVRNDWPRRAPGGIRDVIRSGHIGELVTLAEQRIGGANSDHGVGIMSPGDLAEYDRLYLNARVKDAG